MLFHLPLTYVSLLVLAIGAAAIPPKRVHKLSDLVSTHHQTGGHSQQQPPNTIIRDAQGQAEPGQSSDVHAPHHSAPSVSTETHIPDGAHTSRASKHAINKATIKAKKEAVGLHFKDKLPNHLHKFSHKHIEKGRFAHESAYHKSEQERKWLSSQARTPGERRSMLRSYHSRKNREKKALFSLVSADLMPEELKGLPLEETKARLIATFEGRAEGLFSPELIARAASAMKHSSAMRHFSSAQHQRTVRQQGIGPPYTLERVSRGGNSIGQEMRSHQTEPTARPNDVLPHQTSGDGIPVWREVQQHAHEGSSSEHGNVHATQAMQPDSPFLYDFEWPPTP